MYFGKQYFWEKLVAHIMWFNILLCRKSTDYNEQSDSDENNENKNKNRSKTLRLKFPWFKIKDYQKRDEEYYVLHGDSDFIDSDDDDNYDQKFYKNSEPVCIWWFIHLHIL